VVETAGILGLLNSAFASSMGAIADTAHAAGGDHVAKVVELPGFLKLIPALPMLGAVLCVLCACFKVKNKLPAWITVACLAASFLLTLVLFQKMQGGGVGHLSWFEWMNFSVKPAGNEKAPAVGSAFVANFAFYVDSLTVLWMLFVTGLATLIALYASEYMSHDVGLGYCRFFFAFGVFVFSMLCLVMGDNLLMLFLGWEGVGLCSYLLIGYFYKKPAAVAAAKKAFIMNRIGDLGLMMGIMGTWVAFGTVELKPLFAAIAKGVDGTGAPLADSWVSVVLPALFTIGAFGKSAQLFFYVWLPDAMEGPTPVSALIHAATMVTAGVYLIARMYPLYLADDDRAVLTFVAWAGAITALWAATIEMAIFDIKRVMGYSTISQLGFMFAGLGLLSPIGAAFHTFTHAFFKATLFLGVGAVMHGFGGQLDLRRLSGVMWMRGFGLVGAAMLIGSINLSGVPFTAGYFSKDIILADAFALPPGQIGGSQAVAWILLITAGMTAYYTFRTFFRVYVGPKEFNPGDDAELLDLGRHPKGTSLDAWHAEHGHGHGHGHGHADSHGHSAGHSTGHGHAQEHTGLAHVRATARVDFDPTTEEFDPHPPGLAMKVAIVACALMSIAAAGLYFLGDHGGWVAGMVEHSTAAYHPAHAGEHGTFLGMDPHRVMYYVSAGVGALGILIAAILHGPKGIWGLFVGSRTRAEVSRADALVPLFGPIAKWARAKWYVDEFYDFLIVKPLRVLSHIFFLLDQFLVDGLVNLAGWLPRGLGKAVRPSQSGELHGYAVGMAGGIAVLLLIVLLVMR
jgi:NADH-quinone oxidoreductase subunit L